jgi:co-chaperonin GroES (HSP10)
VRSTGLRLLAIVWAVVAAGAGSTSFCYAMPFGQQTQAAGSSTVSRQIGAIKSINGTTIILTPDSGADVNINLPPTARIVRIAPGEKDLKNATPIQLQDLQVGDRILVGGKGSGENGVLEATTVVVMKRADLAAHQQQDLQDWQKRGVDGLATAVDPAAGTVTISVRGKNVVIRSSKATVIRRYAPDSVKFDDAKSSSLGEIHPGDQVRARGDHRADGTELAAEEIVSGAFRNIAGTVNSIDASSATLNVHDLLSKQTVTVKIKQDSQLHQLPPEVAQRFAMRLRRTAGGTSSGTSGSDSGANGQNARPAGAPGGTSPGGGGAGRPAVAPDLQQMLSRLPAVSLNDLHKGDAVIILSTEGTAGVGTAITLLSGVEPILRAAPNASGASILTPWSLSAPSGDAGGP